MSSQENDAQPQLHTPFTPGLVKVSTPVKRYHDWAGEMGQRLRAPAVIPEVLSYHGSQPSIMRSGIHAGDKTLYT